MDATRIGYAQARFGTDNQDAPGIEPTGLGNVQRKTRPGWNRGTFTRWQGVDAGHNLEVLTPQGSVDLDAPPHQGGGVAQQCVEPCAAHHNEPIAHLV